MKTKDKKPKTKATSNRNSPRRSPRPSVGTPSEVFRRFLSKFFLIFGALLVTGLLFYSFFLPKNRFQEIREKILKNPYDIEARLELAEIYLKNNQFEEAEEELRKIRGYEDTRIQRYEDTKIRGEQTEKLENLWQEKHERDPKEIKKQINNLEKLLDQYPDYRDGHLQLTLLYLKLGQPQKAREILEKALELAPNYKATKDLEKIL